MAKTTTAPEQPDFLADKGAGMEQFGKRDLQIPFLAVLQALSPQVQKKGEKFISGAEAGMILNTVSNEAYEEIVFIPFAFQKLWVEWRDRDEGGGFVRMHDTDEVLRQCTQDDRGRFMLKSGNQIVETNYHYGYRISDVGMELAVIAMSSTQLKASRLWNSLAFSIKYNDVTGQPYKATDKEGKPFTPPLYSHQYRLTTVLQKNAKGTWYGWKVEIDGPVKARDRYLEVAQSYKDTASGKLRLTATPPATEAPETANNPY